MAKEAMQVLEQEDEGTEVELPESETEEEEVVNSEQQEEIEDYSESVKKRISKLTYKVRESERREQAAIEYAQSVQEELNKTKNKI